MSLNPALWEALEEHGLSQKHMEMLLRLLLLQKNGFWAWHFHRGAIAQCDLRVTFGAGQDEMARVNDALLDGNAVPG